MKTAAALAVCALISSSCATIVSGTDDDVRVAPTYQSDCVLSREGQELTTLRSAPGTARVERSGDDLTVTCTSNATGKTGKAEMPAGFNAWTLGNFGFLFPGLIIAGLLIDSFSGAWHGYDDVKVEMK